jgi:hypothetical protein
MLLTKPLCYEQRSGAPLLRVFSSVYLLYLPPLRLTLLLLNSTLLLLFYLSEPDYSAVLLNSISIVPLSLNYKGPLSS